MRAALAWRAVVNRMRDSVNESGQKLGLLCGMMHASPEAVHACMPCMLPVADRQQKCDALWWLQIPLPRDARNLMDRLLCDVDDRLGSNGIHELKVWCCSGTI